MKTYLILIAIGLGAVYAIDLHAALRQKNWKCAAVIIVIVLSACALAASKLAGLPSPAQLLHTWLSPMGRIIWKS